ncbi:DUF4232 domain-containing protein [Actinosynnema sp. NPDC023587]|uniref:DUF4232 domain-containing protein n=1 Tax=Actinosynnema sp. NPDC023587 TaxID=3154695 RepID=UPI0033EBA2A8
MRRLVGVVAVGAALLGTAGTATAQSGAGAPSGHHAAATCESVDLGIAFGRVEGAAGTVYREVLLTNRGLAPCVTRGFPGVSYVDSSGDQVGPAADRDGARGPQVTLAHGATAVAVVGSANVDNFDPAVCRKTPVWGLRVFPPDATAPLYLPLTGQYGCAGTVRHLKVTSLG